jgi:DNA-binding transcriptional MerR regulator
MITIQEVADAFSVHTSTLRRWEKLGLIPPPHRRKDKGWRDYRPADVAAIRKFIDERENKSNGG